MSINVRYKIPFASEKEARAAIEKMDATGEFDTFTQDYHYAISFGPIDLQAYLTGKDKSLIVVNSYCTYLSSSNFMDGPTYSWFPSSALDISDELEYLTSLDAFKGATVHYSSDIDETDELGEPVSPEFLDAISSFATRSCDCC